MTWPDVQQLVDDLKRNERSDKRAISWRTAHEQHRERVANRESEEKAAAQDAERRWHRR